MKKLSLLLLTLSLLFTLCACGAPADTSGDGSPLDGIPEVCRVYDDYLDWSPIADTDSSLPLASSAKRGAPDRIPLWHEGAFSQLGGSDGLSMAELTDGKATEEGAYGRFCWGGQLYHCIHVRAADSFIPGLCSDSGGILWLEVEGDCRADNGTGDGVGLFAGFDTVVITGGGKLTLTQPLETGGCGQSWPALIVDGADVVTPYLFLAANGDGEHTANLVVRSGSLTVSEGAFVTGDICITGGALSVKFLTDCPRMVCWGGVVSIADSWNVSSEHPDMIPTVLLNGGTLNAEGWIDERCEYQLWRGTITAPNLDVLPGVHLLGDSVTLIDPQG